MHVSPFDGERPENRFDKRDRIHVAADHEARTPVRAGDPARGADVDAPDIPLRETLMPTDRIPPVGVPAVGHTVTRAQDRQDTHPHRTHDLYRGKLEPDGAGKCAVPRPGGPR